MSKLASTVYPLSALRAVALHTQHLDVPLGKKAPSPEKIQTLVEKMGCVQIDTLHMVQRSQYVALWSRLGKYDTANFDRLIFRDGERQLFEYWGHAASVIPLKDYRYYIPNMRRYASNPGKWWKEKLERPEFKTVLKDVRKRIKQEGALRTADFKYDGPKRGSWWDWKPAKHALEYLFALGELMIAERVNFQRVYDLRERVLPDWVDSTEPSREEANRYFVEQAVKALGICRPLQAAEYAYMKRGLTRPHLEELTSAGVLVEIEGELADGSTAELLVHKDNLTLLKRAADGGLAAQRTTFLSPFDSLFWARGRDADLWQFRQILEAYKREEDRIWGYFSLPILHRDRLVGRFDPKLERKTGLLRLRHLYLEPGVKVSEELVKAVAGAMREFMEFHDATELVIEHSNPAVLGKKLLAAM